MVLAQNVPTHDVFVRPETLENCEAAAKRLASLFPTKTVLEWLALLTSGTRFLWIAHGVSEQEMQKITAQGLYWLESIPTFKRVYAPSTAHVVGYLSHDQVGISGLEKAFEASLAQGENVFTSLDLKVQYIFQEEMAASLERFSATSGAFLCVHVPTGRIVASGCLPTFDPNAQKDPNDAAISDQNMRSVLEMGSVFKLFTIALALNNGMTPETVFDARGLKVGGFTITDLNAQNRALTLQEIFVHSSNIGSGKIALELGADKQKAFLKSLGLFDRQNVQGLWTAAPLIPHPWGPSTVTAVSYGYLPVTPMHFMRAACSVVRGHDLPLHYAREAVPPAGDSCGDPRAIRALLRSSVKKGEVPGYEVGGKSGTANLLVNGKYIQKHNRTSYFCVFPYTNPEYAVFVTLEAPKADASTYGYATGGWMAAPLASRMIRRVAPLLGVVSVAQKSDAMRALLDSLPS